MRGYKSFQQFYLNGGVALDLNSLVFVGIDDGEQKYVVARRSGVAADLGLYFDVGGGEFLKNLAPVSHF